MPESDALSTLLIVLCACAGLLVLVLLLVLRISSRLSRMENFASQAAPARTAEPVDRIPSAAETSPGGAFELFLSEDPARRALTKSEQFSAYRQWRQEKGMNWSSQPDGPG